MEKEQYDKELKKRQEKHLKNVRGNVKAWKPCMHDQCTKCHGTGIDSFGNPCVHGISCDCPKCNPSY